MHFLARSKWRARSRHKDCRAGNSGMFFLLLPFFCNVRPGRTNLQSRSSAVHRSAQQRQLLAKACSGGAHRSKQAPPALSQTYEQQPPSASAPRLGRGHYQRSRPGTATLGGDSGVTTPSFSASFLSHIGPSSGGLSVIFCQILGWSRPQTSTYVPRPRNYSQLLRGLTLTFFSGDLFSPSSNTVRDPLKQSPIRTRTLA